MAEGGEEPRPKYNQVCRYYINGNCKKGRNCQFSHDKSRVPCRYYLNGQCIFGEKCRNDHVKKDVQRDREAGQSVQNALASNMVTRKKGSFDKSRAQSCNSGREKAMARDFIQVQKFDGAVSYADAVHPAMAHNSSSFEPRENEEGLCPYYSTGYCPYEENCAYLHGEICDVCGMPRLHPTDIEQREQHVRDCIAEHERQMEQSKDKVCGICLENVMEKESKRFGILENCKHSFCLSCIRRWRKATNDLPIETYRACPSCRTHSDFVTPSKLWVERPEEKKKLICAYKDALSKKPCGYFMLGRGKCPFGSSCFYRHALPDGKVVNIVKRGGRRRENAEGDRKVDDENLLWNHSSRRKKDGESNFSVEFELNRETFQDDDDDDNYIMSDSDYDYLEDDRKGDDENLLWNHSSRRKKDGESNFSVEFELNRETFQDDDDDDNYILSDSDGLD